MPLDQHYELALAPGGSDHVVIRWDGDVVVDQQLVPGWQAVAFDVRNPWLGEHELTIEAVPRPFAGNEQWPQPRLPVGVAIGHLDMHLLR
jgi:hypothetical protein